MTKITFEEFKKYTENALEKEGYSVNFLERSEQETGKILTVVAVEKETLPLGLTYVLNNYYSKINQTSSNLKEILGSLVINFKTAEAQILNNKEQAESINSLNIENWDEIKSMIRAVLKSPKKIKMEDKVNDNLQHPCSCVVQLSLSDDLKKSIAVTEDLLQIWNQDLKKIYEQAKENITNDPSINDYIDEGSKDFEKVSRYHHPTLLIKGRGIFDNGSVIFSKKLQEEIKDKFKLNCYLVPIPGEGLMVIGRTAEIEKEIKKKNIKDFIDDFIKSNSGNVSVDDPFIIEYFPERNIFVVEEIPFSLEDFLEVKDFDKEKELERIKETKKEKALETKSENETVLKNEEKELKTEDKTETRNKENEEGKIPDEITISIEE